MKLTEELKAIGNLLEQSYLTENVTLAENFKLKIRTLHNEEQVDIKKRIPKEAKDDILLYSQIEALEMLVVSIIEINGINILAAAKEEIATSAEKDIIKDPTILARQSVRTFLGGLPPIYTNRLIQEFNDLTDKQNKLISEGFGEKVENFSKPISAE